MKHLFTILFGLLLLPFNLSAQEEAVVEKPSIIYSNNPRKYEIAEITVSGVKDYFEDYILIGYSGLTVGQTITIPGDDITDAIKRFWRQELFSDVSISASKIVGDKIYIDIYLKQRPRISGINYSGIKKSEREDLQQKLGIMVGSQFTPNSENKAKIIIRKYYDEKGFGNAEIKLEQRPDISKSNYIYVDVVIDKKTKIKVNKINITGNKELKSSKIQWTMKKTNEKGKLINLFRTKKFIAENYKEDKNLIIDKYLELGYRDAHIVSDSVVKINDNLVNIFLNIDEGQRYHIRDIKWVGNTIYTSEELDFMLRLKAGDVYNQTLLNKRIRDEEDAVSSAYQDRGYFFFQVAPIEANIAQDSVDLEMRIFEGPQATINKITITGNDRLYEYVIRRELRTKPGELFSKNDIIRSAREIAQTGHFNPEAMNIEPTPDQQSGTVDILYGLESKSNDQVELSAGWGQTGIIGRLSLKFSNFSIKNMFKKDAYRHFVPQGDGETLTLSAQTNARYYQAYSISYLDPWFGGKRPNSFSFSLYYSRQSDVSSSFYGNNYSYDPYSYGGSYGGGSYGNNFDVAGDPDQNIQTFGLSLGFGKRLNWPDDYFTFMAELSYQRYMMKDWQYFIIKNGSFNNLSLNLTLSRSSIDNPLFTREGSTFSLSLQLTPPYSLFGNKDYKSMSDEDKNRWTEYHKWKFKSKTFTPLSKNQKLILMTRAEFGFVGFYNPYKKTPFEKFSVGGDGMSGYNSIYISEIIGLRGYENASLSRYGEGTAYTRLGLELRYPLILQPSSTIYALAFVEAGNAWTELKNFNPFDLKRSAGLGVRIILPMIGMLGIDWAYGFDKVFGSRSPGGNQFHFTLGQEF